MKKAVPFFLVLIAVCSCFTFHSLKWNHVTAYADSESTISTKQVDIFGTKYTVHDDWIVEKKENNPDSPFYQVSFPDPNNPSEIQKDNAFLISRIEVIRYDNLEQGKANGVSETDRWPRHLIVERTFQEFKDSLLSSGMITDHYNSEIFDLPETPVLHLSGITESGQAAPEGQYHELYLFMNDYNYLAVVQAYLQDANYSNELKEIIQALEFSYDGWKKENNINNNTTVSSNSSESSTFTNKYGTPTTKCAHPGCNNYIASSGNTNCCTKHSNKCLSCGKYIDEDAMYCIDCLTKATSGTSSSSTSSGNGSSSKSSDRSGLCQYKVGSEYVCNKKATNGYYCKEHYDFLNDAYNSLFGD